MSAEDVGGEQPPETPPPETPPPPTDPLPLEPVPEVPPEPMPEAPAEPPAEPLAAPPPETTPAAPVRIDHVEVTTTGQTDAAGTTFVQEIVNRTDLDGDGRPDQEIKIHTSEGPGGVIRNDISIDENMDGRPDRGQVDGQEIVPPRPPGTDPVGEWASRSPETLDEAPPDSTPPAEVRIEPSRRLLGVEVQESDLDQNGVVDRVTEVAHYDLDGDGDEDLREWRVDNEDDGEFEYGGQNVEVSEPSPSANPSVFTGVEGKWTKEVTWGEFGVRRPVSGPSAVTESAHGAGPSGDESGPFGPPPGLGPSGSDPAPPPESGDDLDSFGADARPDLQPGDQDGLPARDTHEGPHATATFEDPAAEAAPETHPPSCDTPDDLSEDGSGADHESDDDGNALTRFVGRTAEQIDEWLE